jgi:molybdopterin synthase sulfur carrier subunit
MKVNVLAFGQIATAINSNNFIIEDEFYDTNSLLLVLYLKFPSLQNIEFKLAVNKQIANTNIVLNNNDIVALLPPFSGG